MRSTANVTLFIALLLVPLSAINSQDNFDQIDSASVMLNMWHDLPEAVISSVGLSSGASGYDEVPGSLHLITTKDIQKFSYTDPLKTLKTVPGVNITEEDGFGLRPNIGLRGSGTERSSRITIMEDGILIAPAPYTASSAYYFPSIARMSSIEILKGSSQIAFGPQTTSGAINLVSTKIPTTQEVNVNTMYGSFGNSLLHVSAGNTIETKHGQIGYLVELLNVGSDGFKELDNGGDTGFDKYDRLLKLKWTAKDDAKFKQSIQVKLADVEEESHETYLGLTEEDFYANPLRRYAASAQDVMNTIQSQTVLTHVIKPVENLEFITDVYRTEFARNWYKLDRVSDSTGTTIKLSSILSSTEDYATEYSYLTGVSTHEGAGLDVKANNRTYYAQGIQHKGIYSFGESKIEYGIRTHQDGVDRFQWRDRYSMVDGEMVMSNAGEHGTAGNRVESADALASYIRSTLRFGKFIFTPGVRYENITFERFEYGADLEREGDGEFRSNTVSVVLPGAGVNYNLNSNINLFAGIHKGMMPPGSSTDTEEETSINTEFGLRMSSRLVSAQIVAFQNNYENLLGVDLNANGGAGSGDMFNGGSAIARGLEVELAVDPLADGSFDHLSLPIHVAYTYTDAYFTNEFESEFDAWGDVAVGDKLPYLAPHQLSVLASLEAKKFSLDASTRYTSQTRTVAGQGQIALEESLDASIFVDAGLRYNVNDKLQFSAGVTNLLDGTYVVSRRPYGLRPPMPRALRLGIRASF